MGLCSRHGVPQLFDIERKDGYTKLLAGVSVQLKASGLERLGIMVDANADLRARWSSLREVLRAAGYPDIPPLPHSDGTIVSAPERPRVGVWLMPDNQSSGILEDFAATLIPAGDFLWRHAEEAIDRIPAEHRRFPPVRRSKARIHTWLAWQEEPGSPMGQAIGKGDLDAFAPSAQLLVTWLRKLML